MIAPQGKAIGPAGLEPPTEARNRRKATVKNTKNRPLSRDVVERTIPKFFSYATLEGRFFSEKFPDKL